MREKVYIIQAISVEGTIAVGISSDKKEALRRCTRIFKRQCGENAEPISMTDSFWVEDNVCIDHDLDPEDTLIVRMKKLMPMTDSDFTKLLALGIEDCFLCIDNYRTSDDGDAVHIAEAYQTLKALMYKIKSRYTKLVKTSFKDMEDKQEILF